jgi:hypothetical protein
MSEAALRGVKGSLDRPPVIIASATEKTIMLIFGSLGIVCIGAVLVVVSPTMSKESIAGYVGILFSGFCICIGILRLIVPDHLIVSSQGIAFSRIFRTRYYAWSEISEIVTFRSSARSNVLFVGFDRKGPDSEVSAWERFMKGKFGVHVALGGGWPMNSPELVHLLNSARDKWGEDNDARLTAK